MLESFSVIITALVAAFSLIQWRIQRIGERRIDLAEEVLTAFYEAVDIFKFIRDPLSFSEEAKDRSHDELEHPDVAKRRDEYYTRIARTNSKREFFAKLQSLKYRYMAAFGKTEASPFTKILEARARIVTAAGMLYRDVRGPNEFSPLGGLNPEMHEKLEKVLYGLYTEEELDEVQNLIDAAVTDIEKTCSPIIQKWTSLESLNPRVWLKLAKNGI